MCVASQAYVYMQGQEKDIKCSALPLPIPLRQSFTEPGAVLSAAGCLPQQAWVTFSYTHMQLLTLVFETGAWSLMQQKTPLSHQAISSLCLSILWFPLPVVAEPYNNLFVGRNSGHFRDWLWTPLCT